MRSPWDMLKVALCDAGCSATSKVLEREFAPQIRDVLARACKGAVLPAAGYWEQHHARTTASDDTGTYKHVMTLGTNPTNVTLWFRDPLALDAEDLAPGSDAICELVFFDDAQSKLGRQTAAHYFAIPKEVFLMYGRGGPRSKHDFSERKPDSVTVVFVTPRLQPFADAVQGLKLQQRVLMACTLLKAYSIMNEELGFVHRDLKPANVLVAPGPRCVLADFGSTIPKSFDPDGMGKGKWNGGKVQEINYQPTNPDGAAIMQEGSTEAEWWSVGYILYVLYRGGRHPWPYTTSAPALRQHHNLFYSRGYTDIALRGLAAGAVSQEQRMRSTLLFVVDGMMRRDPVARMRPAEALWLLAAAEQRANRIVAVPAVERVCFAVGVAEKRVFLADALAGALCVEPIGAKSNCHVVHGGGILAVWFHEPQLLDAVAGLLRACEAAVLWKGQTKKFEVVGDTEAGCIGALHAALERYISA